MRPEKKIVTFQMPKDIWRRVKVKCIKEEVSLTEVIIKLLIRWLKE